MGSNLSQGGVVALIGLTTVFVVLIILWGILEFMKRFFTSRKNDAPPSITEVKEELPAMEIQAEPEEDESELIAVLTAAIAASLNTSAYQLQIKSYRQINANSPVWNQMSRRENLLSRL